MERELKLPDTGMGITEATILRWCKAEGERVEPDELIAEIETAKAQVDVLSPYGGVIVKLLFAAGDVVNADAVIALIREGA